MTVRQAIRIGSRATTWYVQSETNPGVEYIVHNKRDAISHRPKWTCNCPDFTERKTFTGDKCKHILAVGEFVSAQEFLATQAAQAQAQAQAQAAASNVHSKAAGMTTKEVIQFIVAALAGPSGREVWDVISALRGPDSDDEQLKQETTATLRGALNMIPRNLIISHAKPLGLDAYLPYRTPYGSTLAASVAIKNAVRDRFPDVQAHFLAHYSNALQMLVKLGFIK